VVSIGNELKQTNLESVIRFFNDNWHPIRSDWVEEMQSNAHNYLNRTNNKSVKDLYFAPTRSALPSSSILKIICVGKCVL
jgi:hypothetical protein